MFGLRVVNMWKSHYICRTLVLLAGSISFVSTASADQFELLARTGMASSYGPTVTFSRLVRNNVELSRPIISNSGDICFHSILAGSGVTPGTALTVFCGNSLSTNPVWRQSTQAPGVPSGVNFAGLYGLVMNDFGQATYIASLSGSGVQSGVNDRGVWLGDAESTTFVTRDGTPINIAGYPGASMRWLMSANIAAPNAPQGPVVIKGSVDVPGVGSAIQSIIQQASSGFTPVLMANTQLPGAAPGTYILGMDPPVVSSTGIAAHETTLTGPSVGTVMVNGVSINTDKAITTGAGAQVRTVARSGFPIPTEAPGVAFSLVWGGSARISTNRDRDLAFSASMAGPGIAVGNNWGIWVDRAGQLSRIVRLTDNSPIAGATIGGFGLGSGTSFVNLTDSNAVIYSAMIVGGGANSTNNGTIIHAHNGVHTLVGRGGVDLPALPAGVRILNSNFGLGARIGTAGHVALAAKLQGTGVTSANDAAVFLWAPSDPAGLRLIVREGDVLGSHRVTNISETGVDLQVNAQGQIVFTATVVDVNDSLLSARKAVFTGNPSSTGRIVAVEGGSITLPAGNVQIRSLAMGTTKTLNDSGEASFVADFGTATQFDEAVVVAQLSIDPPDLCPADFNQNGVVDNVDLFAFLSAWFALDMRADFDGSGAVAVPDIFAFLNVWFAGC